jgi:hypothetical protein
MNDSADEKARPCDPNIMMTIQALCGLMELIEPSLFYKREKRSRAIRCINREIDNMSKARVESFGNGGGRLGGRRRGRGFVMSDEDPTARR